MLIDVLKKRISDYLSSGSYPYVIARIEPIQNAIDNHNYQPDVKNPLDTLYLRQKTHQYNQQIINGIQSQIWPAIKITSVGDSRVYMSLLEGLDIFKQPDIANWEKLNEEQLNRLVSIGTSASKEKPLSEQLNEYGEQFKDEQNDSDMFTKLALVYLSQTNFTAQSDNDEKVVDLFNNLVV